MSASKSVFGFQSIYGLQWKDVNGDPIGYIVQFKDLGELREWVRRDPKYRCQLAKGAIHYFRGETGYQYWRQIMSLYAGRIRYMDRWAKAEYLTKVCMGLHRILSRSPDHAKEIIEKNSPEEVDKQNMM